MKKIATLAKTFFFALLLSFGFFFFFTVKEALASHLPQVHNPNPSQIQVQVQDPFGNPITNASVSLKIDPITPPRVCGFEGKNGTWNGAHRGGSLYTIWSNVRDAPLQVCCNAGGSSGQHYVESDHQNAYHVSVSAPGFNSLSGRLLDLPPGGLINNGATNTYTATLTLVYTYPTPYGTPYGYPTPYGTPYGYPTPAPPAPTCNLTADKQIILEGTSTTLSWTISGSFTSASIDPAVATITTASGSITISPAAETTYTITVINPGGSNTCSSTITPKPLPSCDLVATPQIINHGGSSTLSWTTHFALSASIDQGIGGVPIPTGSLTVSPTISTTYTMTVTNEVGNGTCQAAVFLPPTCNLTASPVTIGDRGPQTTLSWTTSSDAQNASINQGVGAVGVPVGSVTLFPTQSGPIDYVLTVINVAGSGTCHTRVDVPFFLSSPNVTLCKLTNWSIRMVFLVSFILGFTFLLVGGTKWITAGGDTKLTESARKTVTYAVLGLVVVMATFAIITLVTFFFNIDILRGCPGPT